MIRGSTAASGIPIAVPRGDAAAVADRGLSRALPDGARAGPVAFLLGPGAGAITGGQITRCAGASL